MSVRKLKCEECAIVFESAGIMPSPHRCQECSRSTGAPIPLNPPPVAEAVSQEPSLLEQLRGAYTDLLSDYVRMSEKLAAVDRLIESFERDQESL